MNTSALMLFLLGLLLVLLPVMPCLPGWQVCCLLVKRRLRHPLRVAGVVVILLSLWALSGCGTTPLYQGTILRVPAALLEPPKSPVLLTPAATALAASPSARPGTTTSPTPRSAPTTDSRTND